MDGGPFRVPRPTDRRAAHRPEPAHRQPEAPQQVGEEPRPVPRMAAPHHVAKKEKSWKRFILPIIGVIIVIILGVGGWFAWSASQNTSTAIDSSKYQAVFFTNGQVYFGKLQPFNSEYMKLKDIYYLQSQQATEDKDSKNPQTTSNDQSNVQLIKLGDEVHGPEDEMVISKDQVLFYENLKTDGKVAQSIQQYKNK